MAASNWCIFRKIFLSVHQSVIKYLAFSSHCLANFQLILDRFIPNFKLKYEDSENIKADCLSTVVFKLRAFFLDTRYIIMSIIYTFFVGLFPLSGLYLLQKIKKERISSLQLQQLSEKVFLILQRRHSENLN